MPIKRAKKSAVKRLAVIDLGTNSVRFDIYQVGRKEVERVFRGKSMIRLGDGVFTTGRLSSAGMDRGLKAFIRFKQILRQMRVDDVVVFGTSALRSASNAKIFIKEVKARTGISIRTISGQEEGRLIAKGILSNIQAPGGHYMLVDIGGGSTEISICYGKKILQCFSFKLGANRLQQEFLKNAPPIFKKGELHPVLAMRQALREELCPLVKLQERYPIKTVIGSSGTIRNIGKILKKAGRSRKPVFRSDISALSADLQTMTREQLRRLPGLEPKRVDLILAGSILLEEILFAAGARHIYYTSYALRDGILQEAL